MGPKKRAAARQLLLLLVLIVLVSSGTAGVAHGRRDTFSPEEAVCSLNLSPCRAASPNEGCCRAISAAVTSNDRCPCLCKQLKDYGNAALPAKCSPKWCPKCGQCKCV